jgi:aryl-alcohol dehydrogenase-like predicted oxidoreductase
MLLRFAHGPETIRLGDLEVRRLGFGAMRLPGKEVWGEPEDVATAHAVLRRAIELGVNLIDTAWYYGPWVANRLICEALHPYPADLVIATKLGMTRGDDRSWRPALRPEMLRVGIEDDLRTLRLEQLPLVFLRWIPQPDVSFEAALDVLLTAKQEGTIRHVGLSNVTVDQLEAALKLTPIAAVQNVYVAGANDPAHEAVLVACEQRAIPFIPYGPPGVPAARANAAVAKRVGCKPAQLSIAFMLARSRVMLPIPGTSKVTHLEQNVGAVHVALDDTTLAALSR